MAAHVQCAHSAYDSFTEFTARPRPRPCPRRRQNAPSRDAGRNLVGVITGINVHLRGERPRSDRGYDDVVSDQSGSYSARQVDERRLTGLIGIGLLGVRPDPIDR